MIVQLSETTLNTRYGTFREVLYYDGQKEVIAFMMGDLEGESDVLCRIHSSCIHGHYFNSIECDCQEQMAASQQLIQAEGKGLVILLDQEGKGNGHMALLESIPHKRKGVPQAEAYEIAGFEKDARNFKSAAKIIDALKINSVRLLTNNPKKVSTLTDHGVKVSGTKSTEQ